MPQKRKTRTRRERPNALQLKVAAGKPIGDPQSKRGGILAALRRSPLVGSELDLKRLREKGRKVDIVTTNDRVV